MNLKTSKPSPAWHIMLILCIGTIWTHFCLADNFPYHSGVRLDIEPESLRVVPVNSSKAKISGRIIKVRCGDFGRFLREPNIYGSYLPSKLALLTPSEFRLADPEFDVMSDGQFSGFLELKDGYYFTKVPEVTVNPGYCWWENKSNFFFVPELPKNIIQFRLSRFGYFQEGYAHKITVYYVDVNDTLAKGHWTKVRIEFAEKNSRVPVKPDVRITIEDGPTYDLIKADWEKKYDAAAVKKLDETFRTTMERDVGRVLKKGDIEEVKNLEAVEFWVFVGSTFKLETRDRNFYYFKGVFTADKAPLTKKTVLLIEVGGKLRSDDEGRGGQIISD